MAKSKHKKKNQAKKQYGRKPKNKHKNKAPKGIKSNYDQLDRMYEEWEEYEEGGNWYVV